MLTVSHAITSSLRILGAFITQKHCVIPGFISVVKDLADSEPICKQSVEGSAEVDVLLQISQ